MANFHYLKLFKYILTLLVIYNIISLLVLFLPQKNLKNYFWKFLPYDYSYLTGYPNYLKNVPNVPGIQKDGEHRYYNPKTSKKKKYGY